MQGWTDVATLVKTKNLDGRFVARRAAGLSFMLEAGMEVAFVPPQTDAPRRAVVMDSHDRGDGSYEVLFEGIDRSQAELLVGCHCLARGECIDELVVPGDGSFLLGFVAQDDALGVIGEVTDIIRNQAQSLLVIRRSNGNEALVPFVDEIVVDIDEQEHLVHLRLPDGLLDI